MSQSIRPSLRLFAVFLVATLAGVAADLPPELAALRTKAESGDAIAEYNLGLAYLQGREIPADFPQAFVWLSLARENGSMGKALDSLLGQMTPQQLEEGQRRLAACRTGPVGSASPASAAPAPGSPVEPALDVARLQEEVRALRSENQRLVVELASDRREAAQTKAALAAASQGQEAATAKSDSLASEIERERAARIQAEQMLAQARNAAEADAKTRSNNPSTRAGVVETAGKFDDTGHGYAMVQKAAGGAPTPANADAAELGTLRERVAALESERTALKEQLAIAAAPVVAQPVASAEGPESVELRKRLADSESKLAIVLRSYTLLQEQYTRLSAEAERNAQSHAAATADASARAEASGVEFHERLRQTQSQMAEVTAENARLRTRLAVAGNPPGGRYPAPTRPAPITPELAPTPVAPPAPPPTRTHCVAVGDTLSGISRQYYGTPDRWKEIFSANHEVIRRENIVPVGAVLKIP